MNPTRRVMENETALRRATVAYTAPFLVFIGVMAIEKTIGLPPLWLYPIRFTSVLLTVLLVSRPVIRLRASHPAASVAIGIAVFLIWIGPDLLFGYRHH